MRKLMLPLDEKTRESLKCGEEVLLSGYIYTARDAAHKRMMDSIPFEIEDSTIYFNLIFTVHLLPFIFRI